MVESLEALLAAHGAALLRLAFMLSGSSDSSQDLMQDTCLKLHRHWGKVAKSQAPLAYSKKVMVNEFLRGTKRPSSRDVLMAEPADLIETADTSSHESQVVDRDQLWILLGQLPPSQRAAVVLRYYEDLSDTQAADLLRCRPATVRANASKALSRLRDHLNVGEEVSP